MGEKHVGLLFVHGVGEQERFGHLRTEVTRLAEWARHIDPDARVSTVDRTRDWPHAPGLPSLDREGPITLSIATGTGATLYHCHEVWWADLGKRYSIGESLRFWTWGLGQWAAAIYRTLDPTAAAEDPGADPPITRLPHHPNWSIGQEFATRIRLAFAAVTAIFTVLTWSLVKRIGAALTRQLPQPSLLVQYLGDVEIYEQRARTNASALADPGFPLRVGIRRRMVPEMVAMGARAHNRAIEEWCVIAHSLGTVLAYNGLTEFGHTLPNYLSEAMWRQLPRDLTQDLGTRRRSTAGISRMMPARPPWLRDDEVIDRKALFARLTRVLTYGSPLDKFAALWPRIIATADDRADGARVFQQATWLNVAAPNDPVSGALDAFGSPSGDQDAVDFTALRPRLFNLVLPLSAWPGVSHIQYLLRGLLLQVPPGDPPRQQLVEWLFAKGPPPQGARPASVFLGFLQYLLVSVALLFGASLLLWIAVEASAELFGIFKARPETFRSELYDVLQRYVPVTLGGALTFVACAGALHWARDSIPNAWFADRLLPADNPDRPALKRLLVTLALLSILGLAAGALAIAAFVMDLSGLIGKPELTRLVSSRLSDWPDGPWISASSIAGGALILVGSALQAIIARFAPKPRSHR